MTDHDEIRLTDLLATLPLADVIVRKGESYGGDYELTLWGCEVPESEEAGIYFKMDNHETGFVVTLLQARIMKSILSEYLRKH